MVEEKEKKKLRVFFLKVFLNVVSFVIISIQMLYSAGGLVSCVEKELAKCL